ncbi:MAG TPA: sulfatase-like hydrolase/transferase, partial [Prosthecobacter sp.]|nr:sulfatase-like hydrolase/transferase [Prosthecobacter sp.]
PLLFGLLALICGCAHASPDRPNIVFVMADDMGWGQTGYRGHPALKTPNLDAMAANGLRFDRFYAGCPVCSPTRASVLTGRSPDRAGVLTHGYALRLQEKTIAQALKRAGYSTSHFGKWHLNGYKGPGAPVLADDPRSPGAFGFDKWVSATNFIDMDPYLGRQGRPEKFEGDSSEIIVAQAVQFIEEQHAAKNPFFTVIWYGTPHAPFRAKEEDKALFSDLDAASANHHGELVAMDRSIGALRQRLRDLGIAENTLLVFCSDNGGLPGITPDTTGGLRGNKGLVYEGGLRVPGIMEWPAVIKPRVTSHPASTMDLFPTVADIVGLPETSFTQPVDGTSLKPLFTAETGLRAKAIPFRFGAKAALVENHHKILTNDLSKGEFELYNLETDPQETHDLAKEKPALFEKLKADLLAWNASVDASFAGKDYPEGKVTPPDPRSISWWEAERYKPYLPEWKNYWAYENIMTGRAKGVRKKGKKGE